MSLFGFSPFFSGSFVRHTVCLCACMHVILNWEHLCSFLCVYALVPLYVFLCMNINFNVFIWCSSNSSMQFPVCVFLHIYMHDFVCACIRHVCSPASTNHDSSFRNLTTIIPPHHQPITGCRWIPSLSRIHLEQHRNKEEKMLTRLHHVLCFSINFSPPLSWPHYPAHTL